MRLKSGPEYILHKCSCHKADSAYSIDLRPAGPRTVKWVQNM